MTIAELLPNLNVNCRILVKMKNRNNWSIPLGGGVSDYVLERFGSMEVIQTSVTEGGNICFYVQYDSAYDN